MLSDTSPIALQRDEGEALWFLGLLAIVKAREKPRTVALR